MFDDCLVCGRPTDGRSPYAFWVSQGGILCRSCQKQEYRRNRLRLETVHRLSELSRADAIVPEHVDPGMIQEMRNVTTAAITYQLGRPPRTLRFLTNAAPPAKTANANPQSSLPRPSSPS